MTCSDCSGTGRVFGLVYRQGGCSPGWINCPRCRGTGAVPESTPAWIEAGERIRQERVASDLSLRERARQLGISPAVLGDAEHGRIDPAPYAEAA